MNVISLPHRNVQNQQQSSWIDDPFDLKGSFKGVISVNHQRNLSDYAQELVGNYAKYDCEQYDLVISDLPEDEKNELVRLYMEATDRETGECVHGNDFSIDNNYTCALLAMLKDDCKDTREHFAEVTRQNIIIYYTDSLQEIIDTACSDYLNSSMNDQGYYADQDMEHGDFHWRKI